MVVDGVVQRFADDFLGGEPEHPPRLGVEKSYLALGVGHENGFGGAVGDALGQAKLIEQSFLNLLAFGDVREDGDGADGFLLGVMDRGGADQHVVVAAVGAHHPRFRAHGGIAAQGLLQGPSL